MVVDCVKRSNGAIARHGALFSLKLNVIKMKRLLVDFLLFYVPVSAENMVKAFSKKPVGIEFSNPE